MFLKNKYNNLSGVIWSSKVQPVAAPEFLSVQEVLLADGGVVSGELLWLVLADGDDGVAHL